MLPFIVNSEPLQLEVYLKILEICYYWNCCKNNNSFLRRLNFLTLKQPPKIINICRKGRKTQMSYLKLPCKKCKYITENQKKKKDSESFFIYLKSTSMPPKCCVPEKLPNGCQVEKLMAPWPDLQHYGSKSSMSFHPLRDELVYLHIHVRMFTNSQTVRVMCIISCATFTSTI